jgi:peptidoglycan glycosyltransferase
MTLARRTWHLAFVAAVLVALVSFRMAYWPLLRSRDRHPVAPDVQAYADAGSNLDGGAEPRELPAPVVQRTVQKLATVTRGTIYDREGRALAYDAPEGRTRVYTEPSLAHSVGYVSGLRLGVTGIEASENRTLLGLDRPDSQLMEALHRPITGSDVHLTIDLELQQVAAQALGGRPGAVVALDGHSGAILAMVSAPGFDPNRILEDGYSAGVLAQGQNAFLNRATQGLYVPGSTWKTVTLIAALDSGQVSPATVFDFGDPVTDAQGRRYYVYEVDGFLIEDPNHEERTLDLRGTYVRSANAAFARMADEMVPATFVQYAQNLGFGRGEPPPIEIAAVPSQLAGDVAALETNNVLRASTGFGQGELLVSPLSMALLAASVVNAGDVPEPHLVQAVRSPSGVPLQVDVRRNWIRNAMRPATARTVHDMMVAVVASGQARDAAVPGATVGGKTGTAQLGGSLSPHAWFIGFVETEARAVAIAVVVEQGGGGGTVAAPIFGQVARAAVSQVGGR